MADPPPSSSAPATVGPVERISPAVFTAITLDDISIGIQRLIDLSERQVPLGLTPFMSRTVDTTSLQIPIAPPWFSLDLLHDGSAGTLLLHVNAPVADPIQVLVGETVHVDFGYPVIERIFLRASAGTIPVRIWGTY